MLPCGGTDTGWKPGGSKRGQKSSLLSDDKCSIIIRGNVHNNRMQGCDMHAEGACKLTTEFGGFCNPSFEISVQHS